MAEAPQTARGRARRAVKVLRDIGYPCEEWTSPSGGRVGVVISVQAAENLIARHRRPALPEQRACTCNRERIHEREMGPSIFGPKPCPVHGLDWHPIHGSEPERCPSHYDKTRCELAEEHDGYHRNGDLYWYSMAVPTPTEEGSDGRR